MKSRLQLGLTTILLCANACSSGHGNNKKGPAGETSKDKQEATTRSAFAGTDTPGQLATWKGSCIEHPDRLVTMQLTGNERYAMSVADGEADKGSYKIDGTSIRFYAEASFAGIEAMNCGLEPTQGAPQLSCALAEGSKVGFFDGCSIIKFTKEQAQATPSSESKGGGHSESTTIIISEHEEPDAPPLAPGKLNLSLAGTCGEQQAKLTLLANGAYTFAVFDSVFEKYRDIGGRYFAADAAATYTFYDQSNADRSGQPEWPESSLLSCTVNPTAKSASCAITAEQTRLMLQCSEFRTP